MVVRRYGWMGGKGGSSPVCTFQNRLFLVPLQSWGQGMVKTGGLRTLPAAVTISRSPVRQGLLPFIPRGVTGQVLQLRHSVFALPASGHIVLFSVGGLKKFLSGS